MLDDKQLDTLTGIADAVSIVRIACTEGAVFMNDDAVEAVLSLYKLGIIRWVADDLTLLTKQFTMCCNLVNDAFNGCHVETDYEELANIIGLKG